MIDVFALQQHPSAIHSNRISHSIFIHSGPQCSFKSLPQFHLRSFFINPKPDEIVRNYMISVKYITI